MTALTRRLYPTLLVALACTLVAVLVTSATAKPAPDPKAPANSVFGKFQDEENWDEWKGQFAEVEMMQMHLELMSQFTSLIGDMHAISESPSHSGVLAVMSVEDNMDTDDAIDFLEDMLKDAEDETILRAIRIKLIDFYKNAGQHDDAAEQIEALITG